MINTTLKSIYRGQSNTGIGEGEGGSSQRGEQYLAADSLFAKDKALLKAIRPWLTFDANVSDQQKTRNQLCGWSYFSYKEWCFIVYLQPAGVHDLRAAYFSHARVYPKDECHQNQDLGLLLAQPQAFDTPWRDNDKKTHITPPPPELISKEPVLQESATVIQLLAHLYQAIILDYPLIMAVSVMEFIADSPLHPIISFIRAALPLKLKCECRIRVYTSTPDLFLRQEKVQLLVIPDNKIREALFAREDALVLNREGIITHGQKRILSKEATAYAKTVLKHLERWGAEGTLTFSKRYSDIFGTTELPHNKDIPLLKYTYFIAHAFNSPEKRCKNLFGTLASLAKKSVDWKKLIKTDEWDHFPRDVLAQYIIKAPAEFETKHEQLFQEYLINIFIDQQWMLDQEITLEKSISISDQQINHLFDLNENKKLLEKDILQELIEETSIDTLLKCTKYLDKILKLEYNEDNLDRWRKRENSLGRVVAKNHNLLNLLLNYTYKGELTLVWLITYVKTTLTPSQYLKLLKHIFNLENIQEWLEPLEEIFKQLLDIELKEQDKINLKELLRNENNKLSLEGNFDLYLLFIELWVRVESIEKNKKNIRDKLIKKVLLLNDSQQQQKVIHLACQSNQQSLMASRLLSSVTKKSIWLKPSFDLLFIAAAHNHEPFTLEITRVLLLLEEKNKQLLITKIDNYFKQNTKIPALLRQDWFYHWYFESTLLLEEKQHVISHWLNAWGDSKHYDIPFELWSAIIEDVTAKTFFKQKKWPRIHPLEEVQLEKIAALAETLDDLEILLNTWNGWYDEGVLPYSKKEPKSFICGASTFCKDQIEIFDYFLNKSEEYLLFSELSFLEQNSKLKSNNAGYFEKIQIKTVIGNLIPFFEETVEFIEKEDLWKSKDFLAELRDWFVKSKNKVLKKHCDYLNRKLGIVKDILWTAPKSKTKNRIKSNSYNRSGYMHIARLLNPDIIYQNNQNPKHSPYILSLLKGNVDDDCWYKYTHFPEEIIKIIDTLEKYPEVATEFKEKKEQVIQAIIGLQSKYSDFSHFSNKKNYLPIFKLLIQIYNECSIRELSFFIFKNTQIHAKEILFHQRWWDSFLKTIKDSNYSDNCKDEIISAISAILDIEPNFNQYKSKFYTAIRKIY